MNTIIDIIGVLFCLIGFSFAFFHSRNLVCNIGYILFHLGQLKKGRERLKEFKARSWDIGRLETFLRDEIAYREKFAVYRAWPLVIAMAGWKGMCDEYANIACYAAKFMPFPSEFWILKTPGSRIKHAVAFIVTHTWTYLVSNEKVTVFRGWDVEYPGLKRKRYKGSI